MIAAAVLVPMTPPLRDRPHGYTIFLASMLTVYVSTDSFGGSGATAVLTAALLLGNADSLVPRLFPGARGEAFTATQTSVVMQDQMTFLTKSFFFFLIGLMFPTDLRLVALGGVAVLFLFAFRIPATMLATRGLSLTPKERWLSTSRSPAGSPLACWPRFRCTTVSRGWKIWRLRCSHQTSMHPLPEHAATTIPLHGKFGQGQPALRRLSQPACLVNR